MQCTFKTFYTTMIKKKLLEQVNFKSLRFMIVSVCNMKSLISTLSHFMASFSHCFSGFTRSSETLPCFVAALTVSVFPVQHSSPLRAERSELQGQHVFFFRL